MITKTTQALPTASASIWEKLNWTWAHSFMLTQFTLQLLLLFPQIGAFRLVMRIASFGLGLFLLVKLRSKGNPHPSTVPAIIVMVILVLELCLHPYNNSILAGIAQIAIYLAILSPIFWVRGLKITPVGFESLMFLMWGFHTLSAIFGVLQVYYPGKFQPALSTVIQNSKFGLDALSITLANGVVVPRPMGLTDTPGGAATAGFYAILFGVLIALRHKNPILKIVCMGSAAIGLLCIYLSQIRSILVILVIAMLFLAVILIRKNQIARLTALVSGVTALFFGTFLWAIAIGGTSTLKRINSLFEGSAGEVYHKNRGHFLQDTIENLLPQYPLGAGLGRWGMTSSYFGDKTDLVVQSLWAEIQWTGWLYDGGIPLIIAYVVAIYWACQVAWKIATDRQLGDFALWGGLIFAYNIGFISITFNYAIFISQSGTEFWLLNMVLFVAAGNIKDDKLPKTVRR